MDLNLGKLQEIVEDRGTWSAAVHGIAKSWIQLSDWTTATKWNECFEYNYQKDFLYRKHYDLNPQTHF